MSSPEKRPWDIEEVDGLTVINFADRRTLDEPNIHIIGEDLLELVNDPNHKYILLDFSRVEFLSSAALGRMITLQEKLAALNGRLVLIGLNQQIADVLTITKLDKVLPVANSIAEARALFGKQQSLAPEPVSPAQSSDVPNKDTVEDLPLTGTLTSDEIRHIETHGISLADAIRRIETSWE
jgi:anti-sigma B factor antagonist